MRPNIKFWVCGLLFFQVQNPKKSVYLNPVAGERAIVIKNNAGDWAFVVGRWKGYKKGQAGKKGTTVRRCQSHAHTHARARAHTHTTTTIITITISSPSPYHHNQTMLTH